MNTEYDASVLAAIDRRRRFLFRIDEPSAYTHEDQFADVSLIAGCFMRLLESKKIWNWPPVIQPTREELLTKYTEEELHDKEMHPDYEYETTETGRKSGESKMPEGDGWEMNCKIVRVGGIRRNWERFDYTDNEYWKRKKVSP